MGYRSRPKGKQQHSHIHPHEQSFFFNPFYLPFRYQEDVLFPFFRLWLREDILHTMRTPDFALTSSAFSVFGAKKYVSVLCMCLVEGADRWYLQPCFFFIDSVQHDLSESVFSYLPPVSPFNTPPPLSPHVMRSQQPLRCRCLFFLSYTLVL